MAARLFIGTSGWNYPHWRDGFYQGIPRRHWLRHCGARFTGVEINATFYRLQSAQTFQRWREQTPADFRFALKANRYLTHSRKLRDPIEPIRTEKAHAAALGEELSAVLWQVPARFRRNDERLEIFLASLRRAWPETAHTIEFRDTSWFTEAVAERLRAHGVAVCQSEAGTWPCWNAVTSELVYVRLHGRPHTYASAYDDAALSSWADRIRRWHAEGRTVHVYFDNDAHGHAPWDALRLQAYCQGDFGGI